MNGSWSASSRAQQEREDPDLERGDDPGARHPVEAPLGLGGNGPRRTSSRKPSPPVRSASATKYSQRTTCSDVVGPDAP